MGWRGREGGREGRRNHFLAKDLFSNIPKMTEQKGDKLMGVPGPIAHPGCAYTRLYRSPVPTRFVNYNLGNLAPFVDSITTRIH